MTLSQLTYFAQVAQLGHMTRAAQELRISQSSLSHAVKLLEEELGVELFLRQGRSLQLTSAGRAFLIHAERVLGDVQRAQREMEEYAAGTQVYLKLGYIASLSQDYLPQLVRRFLEEEPGVQISVSFSQDTTLRMVEALKSGGYDLIFCSDVEGEGLCCRTLLEHPLAVICPPGHALEGRERVRLRDLEPYPLVAYESGSSLGRRIQRIFEEQGIHPQIRYQAPDEQAITALVAQRLGVAVVAQLPELRQAPVRMIPLEGDYCQHVCLCYLKDRVFPPPVRRLIGFITAGGGVSRG